MHIMKKLQDENGQNLFRDENNNFNFDNYDFYSLSSLANCRFSNSSQVKDFPIILSIIASI